jgi:hypothetical protein
MIRILKRPEAHATGLLEETEPGLQGLHFLTWNLLRESAAGFAIFAHA